jgi:RHS repeat-associated protein
LVSQRQSSGVSFYNYDGHGSVRGLSNVGGNVTDTYSYDAFGTLIERTGTTDNNYLYSGEQFDGDLGFYYNRARYLNVETGRFISQDTFEGNSSNPKSLHKYTYAENNSINRVDPSGNVSLGEALVVLNIVGFLAAALFQNTTRAYAPSNDPNDIYYHDAQADYRDAQINLALLIFTLFQVTAGSVVAAETAAGSRVGSSGGFGGGRNPYNPSNLGENCAACVSAVIKSKKLGRVVTADEIKATYGVLQEQNSAVQAIAATERYVEQASGASLRTVGSLSEGPGQYLILKNPTSSNPVGHIVWARVYNSGTRIVVDPQTSRVFDISRNGVTSELQSIIGSNAEQTIYKVIE